jgi:hypothetical protein
VEKEKYGKRDLSYSEWHRPESIKRFIGDVAAKKLSKIDADVCVYVEYADNIKVPLVLIEAAMDVCQDYKCATVTKNLADRANIPAFVLLYKLSKEKKNPHSDHGCYDVESLRFKSIGKVSPTGKADIEWRKATPKQWAETLLKVRDFSAKNLGIFVP